MVRSTMQTTIFVRRNGLIPGPAGKSEWPGLFRSDGIGKYCRTEKWFTSITKTKKQRTLIRVSPLPWRRLMMDRVLVKRIFDNDLTQGTVIPLIASLYKKLFSYHLDQACTIYGSRAQCILQWLWIRPAKPQFFKILHTSFFDINAL